MPGVALTWVGATDVSLKRVAVLGKARIRVGKSRVDPLWRLFHGEPALSSAGIGVDFGFTLGAAKLLATNSAPSTTGTGCVIPPLASMRSVA